MARITVEDCLEKIPNRFQLVLAANRKQEQAWRDRAARDCRRQGWPGNAQEGSTLIRSLDSAKKHRSAVFFFARATLCHQSHTAPDTTWALPSAASAITG